MSPPVRVLLSLVALIGAGVGCDSATRPGGGSGGAGGGGGMGAGNGDVCGPAADLAAAALGIATHPDQGANHVVVCDPVTYSTRPPSSGSHYGVWPAAKTYAAPIPWGFLVHALEHGAVVVAYNCPGGCADEVAAAQAWIDALPVEPETSLCAGDAPRVILVPDPTLDVHWAATAWTWTLRACSFDAPMFQTFFDAHYGHGRETVCRGQFDADQSATGWCP
jgi:hypothetical protein